MVIQCKKRRIWYLRESDLYCGSQNEQGFNKKDMQTSGIRVSVANN